MREKIIAGNWKMYTTLQEGIVLTNDLLLELENEMLVDKKVILIPPFLHIHEVTKVVKGRNGVFTGAQNCHHEKEGAFTGEISAYMLSHCGATYVTIGHSERRQYFNENNALLAKKIDAVLANSLYPIYCCGETLDERESGNHFDIVKSQIQEGLFHLSAEEIAKIIVAYEPVWAIGTGKTASPEQAQEIHAFIRGLFVEKYGNEIAENLHILYGGSVKGANAAELFSQPDIDGGLVGGASLKATEFAQIIKSA